MSQKDEGLSTLEAGERAPLLTVDAPAMQRAVRRCRFGWEPNPECGRPATEILTHGCVHEHIQSEPMCEKHGDEVTGYLTERSACCTLCHTATDEHVPLFLVSRVPVEARAGSS